MSLRAGYNAIGEVIESIMSSVLSVEVEERPDLLPSTEALASMWSATFEVADSLFDTISLTTSESCARQAAARMFRVELANVSDEDAKDAIGEIVNMAGGNVRGISRAMQATKQGLDVVNPGEFTRCFVLHDTLPSQDIVGEIVVVKFVDSVVDLAQKGFPG